MINWLRRVMDGRYGYDQLAKALLITSVIFGFLFWITGFVIFNAFVYISWGICLFRIFSRNHYKRFEENAKFLKYTEQMRKKYDKFMMKIDQRKYYKFYKCHGCKKTLRVPKNKGKIIIKCPHCKTEQLRKT